MAGRAVFGLALGVAVVAVLVSFTRCLKPEKKIEWVRRPDSVIVQMKTVGGLPQPEALDRATVPDFTLYGDGTLIFTEPSKRGQSSHAPLLKTTLPPDAVGALLKRIADTGFLAFSYEQPRLGVYDFPTTYLYASTKEAANAVSAYALDSAAPSDKKWGQFLALQQIKSRLDTIADDAIASGAATNYAADAAMIAVERPALSGPFPVEWPFPDIDLDSIAPDSGVGEQRIEGAQAQELLSGRLPADSVTFSQAAQDYIVAYRPVLPYEDHFPEFETTS